MNRKNKGARIVSRIPDKKTSDSETNAIRSRDVFPNSIAAAKNKKIILAVVISTIAVFLAAIILVVTLLSTGVKGPTGLTMNNDNCLLWNEVDGAQYYILDIDGQDYESTTNSFDVSAFYPKKYNVKVRAVLDKNKRTKFSESFTFEIYKPFIEISAIASDRITKIYDGTTHCDESITLNKHYRISGELKYGDDVDITVTDVLYNSADVVSADKVEVRYSAALNGDSAQHYQIKPGSFSLDGKILQKELYFSPGIISKQFADADNLSDEILDEAINKKVSVAYTRQHGESLGLYDITGVVSLDPNYAVFLNENSGAEKFVIVPRVIDIVGNDNISISKIYDGEADIDISRIGEKPYVIENAVVGYSVDITLIKAEFNSANVAEATKVIVYYDGTLIDGNGVYTVLKSSFEVPGKIVPKTAHVIPEHIKKEFGDADDLSQTYHDDTGADVGIIFVREKGESIGSYDIVSARSESANYSFEIIENSGKNKFTVTPRTLSIQPTGVCLEKEYDASRLYNGGIKKNEHYVLLGELKDHAVDIKILSAYLDDPNVDGATCVSVTVDERLLTEHNVYRLDNSFFELSARVNKKHIELTAKDHTKQYGDADRLDGVYFDDETDERIAFTYIREVGESVGTYDIVSAVSHSGNYEFDVVNSSDKFGITKRPVSLVATNAVLSKEFDNTDICGFDIVYGQHYDFYNVIADEIPSITFNQRFNAADVTADGIILSDIALNGFAAVYELNCTAFVIPAKINPKQVTVEPSYYTKQYGEPDYMRQIYTDVSLGIAFGIVFQRNAGDAVGNYDIVSAVPDNKNYAVSVENGENKFQIAPRLLSVEKVGEHVFTKVYDGTTECNIPIAYGTHYTLTNLNGGTNVSLNIISKEYDSANVAEATKIIVKYSAILDGAGGDQFVTVGGTMEFAARIAPRALTVVPDEFHKDYLSEFTPEQTVTDPVLGDSVSMTFVSTAGVDHILTECDAYDIVTANSLNDNYTLTVAEGAGIGKFVIDRIHLVINATDRNTVYNKIGQSINEPYSAPSRTLNVKYKLSADPDSAFDPALPVNAGEYTARIVFDGDRNYLPQYIERTLFIERAQSIITDTTPTDYVYDGTVKPVTATLNHDEAELRYSRNDHVNADTYNYILISVPQTQNYKAANIVVSFTIARRIMTNADLVFPTAGDIYYGQYLSSSVFSGGSDLGRFTWSTPDIRPVVGSTAFTVEFTPYDAVNNDWTNVDMRRSVDITVNKFVVTELRYPVATKVIYTNALGTSNLIGTSPYGEFFWEDASIVPDKSGYYNVVFRPYDEDNYDFSAIDKTQAVYVEVAFRTYFETNGGSPIDTLITPIIDGEPFTYKEGYVFEGWYFDELCLKKAEFPLRVTADTILYAGWYSEGLIFIKYDDHYSVMLDALTIERNIFIPSEYRGLPVTAIENNGFKNCTALEVIVIPESVVSIGHYAFTGCINLAFVQIKNDIENINFGIDWVKTGYIYDSDVHFNAEPCPSCDGTTDFHQSTCEHAVEWDFENDLAPEDDMTLYAKWIEN